jgi:type I restriction enzyme S subunit
MVEMNTTSTMQTKTNGRSLPKGWRWVKLGDVTRVVTGTTPKSDVAEYWMNGDIVWITPTDLGGNDDKDIFTSLRMISKEGFDSCGLEIVPPGSVVLSSRAPIGHLGIARVPLCTNQGCKSIVPSEKVDSVFLYFALKLAVPVLQELGSGATFKEVSKTQLENFEIPLPPLDEQRRIASRLNERLAAVESARVAAEEQLQAAWQLPSAYLSSIFDNGKSQKWNRRKLGEVCEIIARQVDPKIPEYGALPHVNGENIESGTCQLLYLNSAAEEGMTSGKYLFDAGDVLYSKLRPYLRKVVVADFRGVCSADMYPIKVNQGVLDSHFLSWVLVSDEFTQYADEESRRARMPKLNREQLFAYDAPIPTLDEQRQIAAFMKDKIEQTKQIITTLESQLAEINHLPASLLREAFEGMG